MKNLHKIVLLINLKIIIPKDDSMRFALCQYREHENSNLFRMKALNSISLGAL